MIEGSDRVSVSYDARIENAFYKRGLRLHPGGCEFGHRSMSIPRRQEPTLC